MGHFAEIDKNNIVVRVIVAEQEVIDSGLFGDSKNWIKTSYNTSGGVHYKPNSKRETKDIDSHIKSPLRKNFAGKGFKYDRVRDAFIPPQPFPSWTEIDEEKGMHKAPVDMPDDGKMYRWNEDILGWEEMVGF